MRFSWVLVLLSTVGLVRASDPGSPRAETLRSDLPPDTTHLGIVWTPPPHPDSALQALNRIYAYGATAVRLTRPPSDTVTARADSLGLHLYVDLPVSHVAASRLPEALARAAPALKRLSSLARRHSSITHVGLARSADTTVPGACATLERWTDRTHAQNASLRTYYVTPFSASADRCADAVDLPLLDVRGHPTPTDRWIRWDSQTSRVGLGAIGTWVRPEAPPGLQVPHSPERQARHLERVLSRLLDSTRTAPSAVFVSRWQDRSSPLLPSHRYGLHDSRGNRRPAAAVVRGVYTGTQRAFAFPSGADPPSGSYGLLVLGWILLALLGGLYARSLFVRRTVARYFTAHGFYRDALREGRDLHPGTNGLLLGVVTVALGTTGILAARLAASQPSTGRVLAALPPSVRAVLAGGVEHPITAGIVVGGVVLALLLGWMVVLVLTARRWTRFSFSQGLMLLVWPCWPTLLALPMALATAPDSPLSPSLFVPFLLAGSAGTLVYFTVRVLLDYRAVTSLPWPAVLLLGGLSPLALTLGAIAAIVWQYDIPLRFLWHLATQT